MIFFNIKMLLSHLLGESNSNFAVEFFNMLLDVFQIIYFNVLIKLNINF